MAVSDCISDGSGSPLVSYSFAILKLGSSPTRASAANNLDASLPNVSSSSSIFSSSCWSLIKFLSNSAFHTKKTFFKACTSTPTSLASLSSLSFPSFSSDVSIGSSTFSLSSSLLDSLIGPGSSHSPKSCTKQEIKSSKVKFFRNVISTPKDDTVLVSPSPSFVLSPYTSIFASRNFRINEQQVVEHPLPTLYDEHDNLYIH